MKTSNKNNIRFSGFVVIMVLSLVTVNLTAQKSYRNYALASLGNSLVKNSKYDISHTESANNVRYNSADKEPIENWMINPSDWNTNYNPNLIKEVSFEENEMILEDLMMKDSVKANTMREEEMQLEDWMMKTDWAVSSLSEKEIEIEEWVSKPASWKGANK